MHSIRGILLQPLFFGSELARCIQTIGRGYHMSSETTTRLLVTFGTIKWFLKWLTLIKLTRLLVQVVLLSRTKTSVLDFVHERFPAGRCRFRLVLHQGTNQIAGEMSSDMLPGLRIFVVTITACFVSVRFLEGNRLGLEVFALVIR